MQLVGEVIEHNTFAECLTFGVKCIDTACGMFEIEGMAIISL